MSEEDPVTKKVQIELEIDASLSEEKPNRYQKVIDAAKAFDAWRVFPRIFIGIYIYLLCRSVIWFMELTDPNTQQASLISIITGVGAAWFSSYVNSGKDKETPKK